MADSYRLLVLKRLTTLLEGTVITPVTGIELPANLTGKVFRGRAVYGDNDPETMLSILESPRPGDSRYAGTEGEARLDEWLLLLQGMCPEDKVHPSDPVYSMADDIEKRLSRITDTGQPMGGPLYPEHYMLGPHPTVSDERVITSFQHSAPVIRPPVEKVSSRCFFYMFLQVGLARISN